MGRGQEKSENRGLFEGKTHTGIFLRTPGDVGGDTDTRGGFFMSGQAGHIYIVAVHIILHYANARAGWNGTLRPRNYTRK